MYKLAMSAIINTTEDTRAQLVQDSVNLTYRIVKTAAGGVCLLGPIPYGKTVRVIKQAAQVEVLNTILIGGTTVEVVTASKRYAVNVWNPEADYEGWSQGPLTYAYTSPAVLSGNAYTDRTNVYLALVDKINAYAGNNVTAYGLTVADYTTGTDANSATGFVIGETVTQETSGYTAKVAAMTMTSGTFAATTAAGKIWLYALSNKALWLTTAKTLTGAGEAAAVAGISNATTNCVVTVTNATTYHDQGIVLVDDAGYFTSNKYRGGMSNAGVSGFGTAVPSVILPGSYPIGVGSFMLAQRPVFDYAKQDCVSGRMEFGFTNDELPVSGTYYKKYTFEVEDGDEEALSTSKVKSTRYYVLYVAQTTADHISDLDTAIDAVVLL